MSEPEEGHLERGETATFPTRSGVLSAEWVGDLIWLDFPATPARPATMLPELERALGSPIKYLGRTAFDYLIEVESEADVRSLEPDLACSHASGPTSWPATRYRLGAAPSWCGWMASGCTSAVRQ